MILMYWMYLLGWASSYSDDTLDIMERNSTELRLLTKDLSDHLSVNPTESIRMLEIESIMLEMENVVKTLNTHHSTLP